MAAAEESTATPTDSIGTNRRDVIAATVTQPESPGDRLEQFFQTIHANEPPVARPVPTYELYTVGAIIVATLITPIAFGVLLAVNYARLGKRWHFQVAVACTIAAVAVLCACCLLLSSGAPIPSGGCIALLVAYSMGDSLLGKDLYNHRFAKGRFASWWKAAGVGVLCFIAFVLLVVAAEVASSLISSDASD